MMRSDMNKQMSGKMKEKMMKKDKMNYAKGGMTSCGNKKKMAKGGKVRGCGMAKKGIKKAKMY